MDGNHLRKNEDTLQDEDLFEPKKKIPRSSVESDLVGTNQALKINHPLQIPEILEQIFQHMKQYEDESTIRSICRVSQLWSQIMRKRMSTFTSSEMFRFSVSPSDPPPSCRKFVITLPITNLAPVSQVFQSHGSKIKELNISFKSALEDDRFSRHAQDTSIENLLGYIQDYCPNLSRIIFWRNPLDILPSPEYSRSSKSFRLPVKEIINMLWSDTGTCEMLKHFLINSPNLTSLAFKHSQVEVMMSVLQSLKKHPIIFRNLQSLKAIGMGLTELFIDFFLTCNWSLKVLEIEFGGSISQDRIRGMISHLKETLEKLKIKFLESEYEVGPLGPEDQWIFPLNLKKLENLEIVVHSSNATDCSSFLVNALRLPAVSKLQLSRAPVFCFPHEDDGLTTDVNLFGILWNSSENSQGSGISESSAVRSLCIDQEVRDASLFQQIPNPLVNLTELDIYSTSVDVFLAIFAQQGNLERLSVIIESFEPGRTWEGKWRDFPHLMGRSLDWDEILTARMRVKGQEFQGEAPYLMMPSTGSIRNLKKLKYLHIRSLDTESYLTDFFIYNGLLHLTGLQHLCILENYFSPGALETLRGNLLPFCHIETRRGLNYYH